VPYLDEVGGVGHDAVDVLVGGRDLVEEGLVSRYSMPLIASRSCWWVKVRRALFREYSRPAPCGAELGDIAFPLPTTTYDAVPMDPGISPGSPAFAEIAPLRDTHTCLPKCFSGSCSCGGC
jgi:hypothetical protein